MPRLCACGQPSAPSTFYQRTTKCIDCYKKYQRDRKAKLRVSAEVAQLPGEKRCVACGQTKSRLEFWVSLRHIDGRNPRCIQCRTAKYDPIAQSKYRRIYREKLHTEDPKALYLLTAWRQAKWRAKVKGLPAERHDIPCPDTCPVLGLTLDYGLYKRVKDNSPSLDRIIPEKGYVPGNVRVISYRANVLKNNATVDELLKLAEDAKQWRF